MIILRRPRSAIWVLDLWVRLQFDRRRMLHIFLLEINDPFEHLDLLLTALGESPSNLSLEPSVPPHFQQ